MQAYFGEQAHFDKASTILYMNSEEVWEEKKGSNGMRVKLKEE